MVTSCPARSNSAAAVHPPIEPPTIPTRSLPTISACWRRGGRSSGENCRLRRRHAAARDQDRRPQGITTELRAAKSQVDVGVVDGPTDVEFELVPCSIRLVTQHWEESRLVVDSAPELVGARLRAAGLRVTLPRRAVLGLITASEEHLTAEQVRDGLSRRGVDLPRSSINNILGNLSRRGIVGRVTTVPGPVRFEADSSVHDHYVCSVCGLITNVPSRNRRGAIPPLPGTVSGETTTYTGECHDCQHPDAIKAVDSPIPKRRVKGAR